MIKTVSILVLMVLISSITFAQTHRELSIKYIRYKIDNLSKNLKAESQVGNMYLSVHDNGERWIYIEMQKINGLRSDEYVLSKKISELIIQILFKDINYDLEQAIDIETFANTLHSKSIQGIELKTMNNLFHFKWSDILNVRIKESSTNGDGECQNIEIPSAPAFVEAQITFPMEHLQGDFSCNFDIHYDGFILKVADEFICLKDLQGVIHRIYYSKSDLDKTSASWLPYIMIPGNKVKVDAVTCGNGGIPELVSIKNLRRQPNNNYLDFNQYGFVVKAYLSNSTGRYIDIQEKETIIIDTRYNTFTHYKLDEDSKSMQYLTDLQYDIENQFFTASIVNNQRITHEVILKQEHKTWFTCKITHLESGQSSTYRTLVGKR